MAPLWQAWPIHRTADVYATSRHGAARDFRRSRQDKSRKVRSVEHLQFQSRSKDCECPAQLVTFGNVLPLQSFRHLAAVNMTSNGYFRVHPGCFVSTLARMLSRAASHDRLAAKSRLVGSRSRP